MLPHKKYIDIQAFQTKFADAFEVGDIIQITEKCDGSNCSIQYNPETNELDGYSRKNPLTPQLPLDGAYEYIKRLNPEPFKKYINYRIFGEWNLKHLIKYPPEKVKEFWAFDVYDTVNERWMDQNFAMKMASDCGLHYVPVFYSGPFISWEHIQSFIGRSDMGATQGEGIVIKNQTNLNNPDSRKPFCVKLVCAEYKERMDKPPKEPLSAEELAERQKNIDLVESVVTYNRVEKCLYKMITEDELIPRNWDSSHMGAIAKELPRRVYNDCVKEANDVVIQVPNFGKMCASTTMKHVRELLAKQ